MEYQIMFYGGLAGAVITLIISIIVYMKLQISQVIADLTGNRFQKKKNNNPASLGVHETKRTTSEIKLKKEIPVAAAVEDTALMSQELEPTSMLETDDKYTAPTSLQKKRNTVEETSLLAGEVEETSLLSDVEETALLQEEEETTLLVDDDETTILLEGDGETAILTETEEKLDFQIEVDVMIIHTNKVINFIQQKSTTTPSGR
ncbi:hypothetical protein [Ferdinandcohnia sp. Marseille-Q9671]